MLPLSKKRCTLGTQRKEEDIVWGKSEDGVMKPPREIIVVKEKGGVCGGQPPPATEKGSPTKTGKGA